MGTFMSEKLPWDILKDKLLQFIRFVIVGLSNTFIDCLTTNALVWLFSPKKSIHLFFISIASCSFAIINSYFLNKHWTFRSTSNQSVFRRFLVVAFIAMLINTSLFLFCYQFFIEKLALTVFFALNLAKCVGITVASIVSFIGYRFAVFQMRSVIIFKKQFLFPERGYLSVYELTTIFGMGLVLRMIYLIINSHLPHDALETAIQALNLSRGIDVENSSKLTLYCYFESFISLWTKQEDSIAVISSLLPGVMFPLFLSQIASRLFGREVGLLSGLFTIFHPWLIEYSCNGRADSFYLLWISLSTLFSVNFLISRSTCFLLLSAIFSGFLAVDKSESALYIVMLMGVFISHMQTKNLKVKYLHSLKLLGVFIFGTALSWLSFAILSDQNAFHFFHQKANSLLSTNMRLITTLTNLHQIGKNGLITLGKIPKVLLSPLFLFASFLPLLTTPSNENRGAKTPVILLFIYPIFAFSFYDSPLQNFFILLIPIHIFAAAGVFAFCQYIEKNLPISHTYRILALLILLQMFSITLWRGRYVEGKKEEHSLLTPNCTTQASFALIWYHK